MAKRGPKKPHSGCFKPGQSGNPGGQPKQPAALLRLKKYTREEIDTVLLCFIGMTQKQLDERLADEVKPPTMLELMVAAVINKAVNDGCNTRLDFLLNRIVGRIQEAKPVIAYPESHVEAQPNVIDAEVEEDDKQKEKTVIYEVVMNRAGKFKHHRPQLTEKRVEDKKVG